jgi:Predicted transcriptional regulator containing an HTH domain and an uncharacterized domain shared with the mammalian protein Schlafen
MNQIKLEWTQHRLEEMIANSAEESVHLDFKASGALTSDKRKDICKDVSAFANSDGGILIYGIEEKEHKAGSFSFIDGRLVTKEWLEQVIKDGIQRRIDGIKIFPIRFDGDMKKTVYVVDVPASQIAPHMTKENKYYKRFNFMSVAMEEYEVRNIYNRKRDVQLALGETRVIKISGNQETSNNHGFAFILELNLKNTGNVLARDYRIKIYPSSDIAISFDPNVLKETIELLGDSYSNLYSPTIFPGEELSILNFKFSLLEDINNMNVRFHCYIYTETGYSDVVVDITDEIRALQGLK